MTRDDVIKLLMMIQAAYPNYKPPDKTVTVNMWHEMLKEYDEASTMSALKEFIQTDTSGFAPSIGQLIAKVDAVRRRYEIRELEVRLLGEKNIKIEERGRKAINGM